MQRSFGTRRKRQGLVGFGRGAIGVLALGTLGSACQQGLEPANESAGNGGASADEAVSETAQPMTSGNTCWMIQRAAGQAGVVQDAHIFATSATKNFGTISQGLVVGFADGQGERQALLRFDLSTLQLNPGANYTFTNALLQLVEGFTGASAGAGTVAIHRVTASWAESTVTWANAPSYDPIPWKTFSSIATSGNLVSKSLPYTDLGGLAREWLADPSSNHGILLKQGAKVTQFYSSEYANYPTLRPALLLGATFTCKAGYADCNGDQPYWPCAVHDGCEVNLTNDENNCGACGNVCSIANGAAACVNGTCQVAACNVAFSDCNGNPSDGCETLLTTLSDCGGCGVACSKPNGTASCETGTCTLTDCNPGHDDCDGHPSNGCEALPCTDGSHCANPAGCASGVCANGYCATSLCSDGVMNGSETSTDCGGASCPPCAVGLACQVGSDCTSSVCLNTTCAAPSCGDQVKNGNETGVDCGGPCAACAPGTACLVGEDCTSGVCTAGVCQVPTCTDGVTNGSESAVDCGGSACPACATGKACSDSADCVDHVCTGHLCQLANCADGVTNGSETGTDCGGPCAPCSNLLPCLTNADCASGVCQSGVCQVPTCSDGVKNAAETGVDCGGECTRPEVCNGIDDDCNGLVDDGLGTTTCGMGVCQITALNCVSGTVQSCVPLAPQAEICEGLLDEDCNGIVDNGCDCINGKAQTCYSAAPSTLGVGVCATGTQTCAHGAWGACMNETTPSAESCDGLDNDCNGQVDDGLGQTVCGVGECQVTTPNCLNGLPQTCTPQPPHAEQCDGLDNDCDGVIDNGEPGSGAACATGNLGVCAAGTTACSAGSVVCIQTMQPSTETCNGLDDNCNGQIDENNPGGGVACTTGKLGVCASGTTACSAGALVCNQNVQPSAETCDGLDNNCNGQIDEGVKTTYYRDADSDGYGDPNNSTQACTQPAGYVTNGSDCDDAKSAVRPGATDVCNGLDDNCNGTVDENNPGGGVACTTGKLGVCATGTTACSAGALVCNQNVQPSTDVCNGLDDNCNGTVDENNPSGGVACSTGKQGVCAAGTTACSGGAVVCNQNVQPSTESCDGLDNNCNGTVDENNPGGGVACSTGKQGACAAGTTACSNGGLICNQNVQPSSESCDGVDNDCNGSVDDKYCSDKSGTYICC